MISLLLAEIPLPEPGSPQSIGWLVLTFAALALAVNQIMGVVEKFRARKAQPVDVTNSPLTVRPHIEYTPLAMHQEFEKKVDSRFAEMSKASSAGREKIYNLMREQGETLRKEIKDDNNGLHDRITQLLAGVSELRGKIESTLKK